MLASRARSLGLPAMTEPVVCVGAVVCKADQVLLVRQPQGHSLQGQWTIPWGRLDPGESPSAAVLRETWEEGSVRAEIAGLLGVQEIPPTVGGPDRYPVPLQAHRRRAVPILAGRRRTYLPRRQPPASHKSTALCAFSQNSGLFPKRRDSLSAIAGLTARLSLKSSLTECRDTPIASAKPLTFEALYDEEPFRQYAR